MTAIFPQGNARFSFDGMLRMALDSSGGPGTTYAFPCERIRFMSGDNAAYPDVIDNAQFGHIKSLGVVMGTLTASGIVMPDRGFAAWASAAFGPRTTGLLTPWIVNLLPFNSGGLIKFAGVYINRLTISGAFSTRGDGMIIRWSMAALVLDPNNIFAAATLTPAGTEGLQGLGPSSFAKFKLTNGYVSGAGSLATYDLIKSFDIGFDNGFAVQPSVQDNVNRIASGCTPSPISGSAAFTQLKGAASPIPQATSGGSNPFQLILPTGDATHTMTVDASLSWDSLSSSFMPNDFLQGGCAFTLYSTSSAGTSATGTANYPVVFSYV